MDRQTLVDAYGEDLVNRMPTTSQTYTFRINPKKDPVAMLEIVSIEDDDDIRIRELVTDRLIRGAGMPVEMYHASHDLPTVGMMENMLDLMIDRFRDQIRDELREQLQNELIPALLEQVGADLRHGRVTPEELQPRDDGTNDGLLDYAERMKQTYQARFKK